MENFNDKIVMITGAASGLGQATALAFAERGAVLSLADINEARLKETEAAIIDKGGKPPLITVVDVATRLACHQWVDGTVQALGGVDVLCNVAGILGTSRVANVTEDQWNKLLAVNLSAPFWLSQAAIPHLIKRGGNIVNISSSGAFVGEAYQVAYTATKAAITHMTKSMAMEYLKENIRINAVAPGAMVTNILESGPYPEDVDMELIQRYMPVRAHADASQVADLVVYLASDRAANIHGACLSSDGGMTAG